VSLQTLDRAMAALRLLAASREGLRLMDIRDSLELSKPTAHRLLAALIEHDFVRQDAATRLYRLGPGLDTLRALRPDSPADLKTLCMSSVYALAEASGDTVFLVARDRMETICIARESGSYPIRAITIEVGTRRPLGVGAGGLSILGALDGAEARRLVAALQARLRTVPTTSAAQILRSADQARRLGYAFSDEQVVKGVRGVAVCMRDAQGSPVAALGIAAINERLRVERVQELVQLIRNETAVIEKRLRD
jgi:DNA-binding IclR family transcriptional regulator